MITAPEPKTPWYQSVIGIGAALMLAPIVYGAGIIFGLGALAFDKMWTYAHPYLNRQPKR